MEGLLRPYLDRITLDIILKKSQIIIMELFFKNQTPID